MLTAPGSGDTPAPVADEVRSGRDVASARERWQATGSATKWTARAAAAVLLLTAAVCLVLPHSHPRHATRTAPDPALTVGRTVDATGCPIGVSCTVDPTPSTVLVAAVRRTFGGKVVVLDGSQTMSGSRVYSWQLMASVRVGTVAVSAQCVPGASVVPASASTTVFGHDDLSGNRRVDYRRSYVVVAGDRGCSVVVQVDASDSGDGTFDLARQVAGEPVVQGHPRTGRQETQSSW
ncbi:MAG: hypothetical protein ACR2KJ_14580 [Jatrophihabitans sp.]